MKKEIIERYLKEFHNQEAKYEHLIKFFESSELYSNYHPKNWIKNKEYEKNFAQIIKELLEYLDKNKITYSEIHGFTRFIYYYCLINENIVIWELKASKAFKALFHDCYFEIFHVGGELCNTSRKRINLLIELILSPENIITKFKALNEYDEEFERLSPVINNPEVSKYLIRILKKENQKHIIERILKSLEYQNEKLELQ